jgi:ribosome silencing factor RsfS/YbeB/iojap
VTADSLRPELRWAIEAAQDKQASAITLLDMTGLGAFTEAFLLCTGFSTPQVTAIAEAVEEKLREHGLRPIHREGRHGAEWLLLDYGRFLVHIFTERQRLYYDLERLWRAAKRIDVVDTKPDLSAADGSGLHLQPGVEDGSGLYLQPGLKKSSGS